MKFNRAVQIIKRNLLKRFMSLFSLSAVAFTFQACYGSPIDTEYDVIIAGKVIAADTGEPIPGILVSQDCYYLEDETDTLGNFRIYAPLDSQYLLRFMDVDSTLNGLYSDTELTVERLTSDNEIQANISLERVN